MLLKALYCFEEKIGFKVFTSENTYVVTPSSVKFFSIPPTAKIPAWGVFITAVNSETPNIPRLETLKIRKMRGKIFLTKDCKNKYKEKPLKNSHYFANVFEFISNSFSSCFSLKNFIQ